MIKLLLFLLTFTLFSCNSDIPSVEIINNTPKKPQTLLVKNNAPTIPPKKPQTLLVKNNAPTILVTKPQNTQRNQDKVTFNEPIKTPTIKKEPSYIYEVDDSRNILKLRKYSFCKAVNPKIQQVILKELSISSCETVNIRDLEKVTNLNLSNKNIIILNLNDLYYLKNLESLNLSYNELQTLPRGIFNSLKKLKYLFLNNNKFNTLSLENTSSTYNNYSIVKNLEKLHLENNNFSEDVKDDITDYLEDQRNLFWVFWNVKI